MVGSVCSSDSSGKFLYMNSHPCLLTLKAPFEQQDTNKKLERKFIKGNVTRVNRQRHQRIFRFDLSIIAENLTMHISVSQTQNQRESVEEQ